MGNILVIGGIILIIFGLAFAGRLGPLGRLPGDISIERGNSAFYFPIGTSILLSIVLSLILWAFRR